MSESLAAWWAAGDRVSLGAADPAAATATRQDLLWRWREPHRHYHTEAHLSAVLSTVDRWAATATDPDLVRLAAWCHDARELAALTA